VDGSGDGYPKTVCDYVHLNPVRASLLPGDKPLRSYVWSSWPEYLKHPRKRWSWLRVDRLLGEYQVKQENADGGKRLEAELEQRRAAETGADYGKLRRGWCIGPDSFRKELLEQAVPLLGAEHYGAERHESTEQRAEEIVTEELRRRGLAESKLAERKKGDADKLQVAIRLRAETTVTVKWIAGCLSMGAPGYLNHLLYRHRHGQNNDI